MTRLVAGAVSGSGNAVVTIGQNGPAAVGFVNHYDFPGGILYLRS